MVSRQILLQRVAEVYDWIDSQIYNHSDLSGVCDVCGRCCDFDSSEHRLFVSTPEMMYLAAKLGEEKIRPMKAGRCPYQEEGRCTIYKYRFAGCRIFCCKGDKDFQSKLSELALQKFKSICNELGVPYRYCDSAMALNSIAG